MTSKKPAHEPAAPEPAPRRAPPPGAPPSSVGWGDVVAASDALADAERPVEPRVGDLLQHPVLGTLDVLAVDDARLEVRDRGRARRKLARAALEFRLGGERLGKRVLKVKVRTA
ncbi:MAG: hypothetical protein HY905_22730 [Deltaproteobacteria bacterium]|nr:hypothetical protein [Deltaproteobacteria bacterium]